MKPPRKNDMRIPRKPLLWLAAALLFTVPPMFGDLAGWVPGFFLLALAAKFWMEPRGYRLRSLAAKLLLAGTMLAGVFVSYGSAKGMEPGISLIVLLMSIKILESHTAREFQVMIMVAFVLCLCGFFTSQNLPVALSLLVAFILLIVGLVQFHRGPSSRSWPAVRTTMRILAQAVPVVALLFLFFPRFSTGFRMQFAQSGGPSAGFSGELSPGSVTSLAGSSEIAFRVEFPDGVIPPPNALYWRGAVMWHSDGFDWHAPESPAALPRTLRAESGRAPIRQSITIEPHHHNWLFALDWPAGSVPGAFVAPGNYLWSGQPIHRQRRYEVASVSRLGDKRLNERERKLLLQSQPHLSPKAWSLAQSWTSQTKNPQSIVNAALEFFRTQGFRYSMSPGEYKKNGLDEFLFVRRQGFCEHYASSFATLMRFAGIPSRVVTGYLGGEYNELGKFLVVRQADAHAWCEVWLPGTGWERIDPTGVVAPDRINLGLNSFLERRASGQTANRRGALARWPYFIRARLAWQTLKYTWDTHVIGFDSEAQEALIAALGAGDHTGIIPVSGICVAIAVLLGLYAGWNRLRSRSHEDRVKQLWNMFCRKTARLGVTRNLTEGPLAFSHRATQVLPNESQRIRTITDAYIQLRFASREDRHLINTFARDVVLFGR